MRTEWNGCQIHTTEVADDLWEAQLEYDDGGPLGTGATELDACRDLIDQLKADAANADEMAMDAAWAKAEATIERRVGL